jgi:hypothetical protein
MTGIATFAEISQCCAFTSAGENRRPSTGQAPRITRNHALATLVLDCGSADRAQRMLRGSTKRTTWPRSRIAKIHVGVALKMSKHRPDYH